MSEDNDGKIDFFKSSISKILEKTTTKPLELLDV
jgi:hypothetical protein